MSDIIEKASLVVSVLIIVAAIVSGAYIAHVYRQRKESAPFLDWMVRAVLRIVLAAIIGAVYLVLVFLGYGLGRPLGPVVIQIVLVLPLTVVISMALLWFNERRAK